jgi:hypothetical protein
MRGGIRKTIALETRDESDAIRRALELANGPDLAIGGTLEGEIEAFVGFEEAGELRAYYLLISCA